MNQVGVLLQPYNSVGKAHGVPGGQLRMQQRQQAVLRQMCDSLWAHRRVHWTRPPLPCNAHVSHNSSEATLSGIATKIGEESGLGSDFCICIWYASMMTEDQSRQQHAEDAFTIQDGG